MKKFIILFISVIMILLALSGCNEQNPGKAETTSLRETPSGTFVLTNRKLTKDNFPGLDGSTANIPMANLIIKKLLNMSDSQIAQSNMTEFTTTPYAYDNLIKGETDLLLVYEADEETKGRIKKSGVELEYYPIGKDALVFITNEINKVKSLTEGQIQDIYQGKTTNWNQVSGDDVKIEAFTVIFCWMNPDIIFPAT